MIFTAATLSMIRGIAAFTKQSSRALHATQVAMAPIKAGDRIPTCDLFEDSPANKVNLYDLSAGKKFVVFGVPGAFTPGCSKTHLPGYVEKADELKKQCIDEIICISVNDPYVMAAWGNAHCAKGKVRMLADPSGIFTQAMDLHVDLPPLGGIRSKRYSMIVQDRCVQQINVEPDGTGLSCSLANNLKLK